MGGLGPGIGGFEIVVIGLVALLVVGPKDLPVLMRRVGQMVAKARAMANEFRSSFDEMARQSELDDLRKEVEALRTGQGMYPLGQEAQNAFKDINSELTKPLEAPSAASVPEMTPAADEWPDTPVAEPATERPEPAAPVGSTPKSSGAAAKPAAAKPAAAKTAAPKPKSASKPAKKPTAATKAAPARKTQRKKAAEQ
ncbi:Sec-independent protein translocase protein TatB [Brevundimonas sp.]|uniref:Sec-independent protein translocase protein TatB n=1 Tax=Brevundimonas sp. TaxID=1871086 RepID=UPI0035B42ADA